MVGDSPSHSCDGEFPGPGQGTRTVTAEPEAVAWEMEQRVEPGASLPCEQFGSTAGLEAQSKGGFLSQKEELGGIQVCWHDTGLHSCFEERLSLCTLLGIPAESPRTPLQPGPGPCSAAGARKLLASGFLALRKPDLGSACQIHSCM